MTFNAVRSRLSGSAPENCQATAVAEATSMTESRPKPVSAVTAQLMDRQVLAAADTVSRCIGFRPALAHLAPLGLCDREGHVCGEARLHLLGYGNWTGLSRGLTPDTSATVCGWRGSCRL
ncbi:hypothetical protein [Saccharothrix sp. Mg75]|uniref:hypothetical protein n=1 Tax=Saccharothrix sp. Mg75 TaxID=3445357 RepID=UPI003EEE3279